MYLCLLQRYLVGPLDIRVDDVRSVSSCMIDVQANSLLCRTRRASCATVVQDKKKVVADEPVFGLASVDLVETEGPTWHIAQHLPAIRCTPLFCCTTGSFTAQVHMTPPCATSLQVVDSKVVPLLCLSALNS